MKVNGVNNTVSAEVTIPNLVSTISYLLWADKHHGGVCERTLRRWEGLGEGKAEIVKGTLAGLNFSDRLK
jgi:hypothetical protein